MPPIAPIVEDAASFEVAMLIAPVEALIVACRLLAASAALSPFSVETWPLPVPKVIEVAVPPPVAPMVSVSPCSRGGLTIGGACGQAEGAERAGAAGGDHQVLGGAGGDHELAGALTVEAVPAPVMPSIAVRTLPTVRVEPAPTPIVTLPLASVVTVVCRWRR